MNEAVPGLACSSPGKICVDIGEYGSIQTENYTAAECGSNGTWQERESCAYVSCGVANGSYTCRTRGDGGALVTAYQSLGALPMCDGPLPPSPISF